MLSTHTHKFESFWVEFNVNWCRMASKKFDLGFTKIRDNCVPGKPKPGLGTQAPKYGTSREIRDGWQDPLGYAPGP